MRMPKPWFRKSTQTWYVQINGKQINLGKDKVKAFDQFHSMMHKGVATGSATVRQVVDAYWNWLRKHRAEETSKVRRGVLQSFGNSVPKTLKAAALKPLHVQRWIDANGFKVVAINHVRKNPQTGKNEVWKKSLRQTDRPVSPTTINTRISLIIGMMSWAKSMGYIDENSIEGMPMPERTVRQEFIPANLWQQVLDLATDQYFRDWLTVMLLTGCRAQEMFKFKAEHLDGNRFVLPIGDSKGKKRSRVVYLPDEALAIVQRLAKENAEGALFRNRSGNPWDRNSVRMRFRRFKRLLRMPKLCATTLRHSFAHHRLTIGQDSLTIAKLMGHRDTRMLATRYGHVDANADYMANAANLVSISPVDDVPS